MLSVSSSGCFFADPSFEPDFKHIEDSPGATVTFLENTAGLATKERARKLYLILGGILKNRPLKILRQVQQQNGLEAWRQLSALYVPRTKGRSLALLNAVMQFPVMSRDKTMLEQILLLERVSDEYTKAAGQQVAPDILLSTLVRILPKDVQRHVQLTMSEDATYAQVREQVLAHERISSTWSKDRVMADISGTTALGTVTSYAVGDGGAAPMEVNQIKGKAKGKGKFGSGKAKGKGKPVIPKGKGKGKPSDKGKGKGYSSKGYGDGSSGSQKGTASGKIDANTCAYCGKAGHWARDCRKKKADSQVRQVEESDPKDAAHSSGTAAASSTAIRAVQMLEPSTSPASHVHFEDLTVFSKPSSSSSPFNLCVVSEVCSACAFPCVKFDMTCTDGDSQWTICPELKSCCCSDVSDAASFQHVRVVIDELSDDSFMPCDVILDSGADISVLPLHYSGIGEVGPAPDTTFVDAQGCPLAVESTRIATLQFGNVAFREKFIIADVTTPLVALGHIIRAGWSLVQHDGGPCLVKDDKSIEVLYKNNSLCAKGTISMISQVEPKDALPSVRAVQLGIALRTLRPGWNKLNPQLFAIKTTLPKFVDTTTTPSDELMWLRTTLVCREGGTWEVVEFCEAIGDLPAGIDEEIHFPRTVLEVVTLAHKYALPAEDLGFYMPGYEQSSVPEQSGLSQQPSAAVLGDDNDDMSSGYAQSIAADLPEEPPVDAKDGEPLAEDREIEAGPDEAVVHVDGTSLTIDSSLRSLRAGCVFFGLSKRGSKRDCLKRMLDHIQTQNLLMSHAVEVRLKAEAEREVRGQSVPKPPTPAERQAHSLTHEPYQPWCEVCVMHRGRQDPHPKSSHEHAGHSVVSFDFCFCSRKPGEDDKQTCLVLHDRDTQLVHVIPTQQKAGKSLQYLVTEFVRFITHTQHRELSLRSDLEPSNLAIADAVRRTCRGLGLIVHHEPVARGDHQQNGAVESTLEQVRARAGVLVSQIEKEVAGGKLIFPATHPVYNWALLHSAWLINRYVVKQGTTAYERSSDRVYSGKLCMYGESVLGYIKTDRKAAPRWSRGIWLGKTLVNDTHIIAHSTGVFVTRSVRRLPTPFVLEELGDLHHSPWEFGYASLGHRMLYNRHVSPPQPLGMPMIDIEAVQVQKYAAENPHEDDDPPAQGEPAVPAQAGLGGAPAAEGQPLLPDTAMKDVQKRGEAEGSEQQGSPKKARVGEEQPVTPPDIGGQQPATPIDVDAAETAEERASKVPKLTDSPKQQHMMQITSTDLSLYEHEDSAVQFHFCEDDLDRLEQYDLEFYDDELLTAEDNVFDDDAAMKQMIEQLTFPYSAKEPDVSPEELTRLDGLADQLELQRLQKLHVLKDPSTVPVGSKVLSTRFVRTWREKHNAQGQPVWLRRSRFVAREFAWLEPERESLFSPASGSIISRILPTVFLEMRDALSSSVVLASLDVRDAFLTVEQENPTLVHTTDASGNEWNFALGRVLPGQRDGSLLWYRAITSFLKKNLELEEHLPYPCVLKSKDNSCIVMIHVGDLLVVGKKSFVLGRFADELKKVYDISMQYIEKPGDEVTFLKRVYSLQPDGRLTVQTHHKHVMQLCSLLGMNPKTQGKKSPSHADIDKEDHTNDLDGEVATCFRTCVGILMYLANDLPHCQYTIRHLSTYSSKPTEKSMTVLRHLVSYLACHGDITVSLKWSGRTSGIFHGYPDVSQSDNVLEVFTDSDWANDKNTRRSVSACVMFYGSCLLFSASRTQKIVSLSSAEAEVYACSSGSSDAVLLSRLLSWLTGRRTLVYVYTDSSGARGILQRQGVGRLRHLSCRILWLQGLIATGVIRLCSVSGHTNPADLGTKRLSASRLRSLMAVLGLFNTSTGALEGCDDPGRVFTRRQNVRALLCALSLLQLQGCEDAAPSSSWATLWFTLLLGLVMMLPLVISLCSRRATQVDQIASQLSEDVPQPLSEPFAMDESVDAMPLSLPLNSVETSPTDALSSSLPVSTTPTGARSMRGFDTADPLPISGEVFSTQAMLTWMYTRCLRRQSGLEEGTMRWALYAERINVIQHVMRAYVSGDDATRHAVEEMTSNMSDLSEDESSPTQQLSLVQLDNELNDVERAVEVGTQLTGLLGTNTAEGRPNSVHVNAVADAMLDMIDGENAEEESAEDSDEYMETASERRQRYLQSELCECSDPDEWMVYHHGMSPDNSPD